MGHFRSKRAGGADGETAPPNTELDDAERRPGVARPVRERQTHESADPNEAPQDDG
jgi:hypothetical protein